MIAGDILSDTPIAVSFFDPVQKVYEVMADAELNSLPVVENEQLLGTVFKHDLANIADRALPLREASVSLSPVFAAQDCHILDLFRLFSENLQDMIPVVENDMRYVGYNTLSDCVGSFSDMASLQEPGGIIVLETSQRNHSLAHISQVVESNNAQILSFYISSGIDNLSTEITLKVNRTEISDILASFGRYEYVVKASFGNKKESDSITDRYDHLMNYLNL